MSNIVFQPCKIGNLSLRNRIAMAPMTRRKAQEDGIATDEIIAYYQRRAVGEVGLIISEGTPIDSEHAYDTATVPRFETDEQLAAWKKVVDAIHKEGSAFAPQLWHTGRFGYNPIGPSACELPPKSDGTPRPKVKAMDSEDIAKVRNHYAIAAKKAKEIGCDAIEIHGAHGYLLDSFVSPVNNQRTDEYGGSLQNRMRFPLEVVRDIRAAVGEDYPVIYRFSQWQVDDYEHLKFHTPDDLKMWVTALDEAGVDILHVSTYDCLTPGFPEVDDKPLVAWSKELSGLPCIAVGKISVTLTFDKAYGKTEDTVTNPDIAMALIDKGQADLLAIGRALIANPDWAKIVREGNWQNLQPFHKELLKDLV